MFPLIPRHERQQDDTRREADSYHNVKIPVVRYVDVTMEISHPSSASLEYSTESITFNIPLLHVNAREASLPQTRFSFP